MAYVNDEKLYHSFGTAHASDIRPDCDVCYSALSVKLVDVIVPNMGNSTGFTLPIWHCSDCARIFGARSASMVELMAECASIAKENLSNFFDREFCGFTETIVEQTQMDISEIKKKITELEEDPLVLLRNRVAKFDLEV